jgi:heterodisulfide reductase subunit B
MKKEKNKKTKKTNKKKNSSIIPCPNCHSMIDEYKKKI